MKNVFHLVMLALLNAASVSGFVLPSQAAHRMGSSSMTLNLSPAELSSPHYLDDFALTSTLTLAETQAWVQPTALFLDPLLNFLSFAMLARVVLSWYPETKVTQMPWALLVYPTEPLLRAVKGFVPPAFGVDITPVFWLAIFTFIHEILLGQQGLLTMKIKYGI